MQRFRITHKDGTTEDLHREGILIQSARQEEEWQTTNQVTLELDASALLPFRLYSYIEVYGQRYYCFDIDYDSEAERTTRETYTVILHGPHQFLYRVQCYNTTVDLTRVRDEVPVSGNLYGFAQIIINNLNRVHGAGSWRLGDCPTDTLSTEMSFIQKNCLGVLNQICEQWKTHWTIEMDGEAFVLNIGKDIPQFSKVLEHGIGKGIVKLTLNKTKSRNICTKLMAKGAAKNLPIGYRNYTDWNLRLPEQEYPTSEIMYEEAVALWGVIEDVYINNNIYPRRKGHVTDIETTDIYSFRDTTMPGDIAITKGARVSFRTGNLAGLEFEISDYNQDLNKFTIKKITDANGLEKPSPAQAFMIAPGDEYTLLGIIFPPSYTEAAENELLADALQEAARRLQREVSISINTETGFFKRFHEAIVIGQNVHVKKAKWGIDKPIRIRKYVRDLLKTEHEYESIELSDIEIEGTELMLIRRINAEAQEARQRSAEDATTKDINLPESEQFIDNIVDKLVVDEAFIADLVVKRLITDPAVDKWQISINDNNDNHIRLYKLLPNGLKDPGNMLSIVLGGSLGEDSPGAVNAQMNITNNGFQAAYTSRGFVISKFNTENDVTPFFRVWAKDFAENAYSKVVIEYLDSPGVAGRLRWPDEGQVCSGGIYRNNPALLGFDEPRIKR